METLIWREKEQSERKIEGIAVHRHSGKGTGICGREEAFLCGKGMVWR